MTALNVAMLLEHAAHQAADTTYVIAGEQHLSYSDVEQAAQRFANVLNDLAILPGEKVALLVPNIGAFPVCFYGSLKLGAVPVPLSVVAPGPEIAYFLQDAEATVLVAFEPLVDAALAGFAAAPHCRHLIIVNGPGSTHCPEPAKRFDVLLEAATASFETIPTRPDDPAVILYTSGTTGRPKGAVLTHMNYYFFSRLIAKDLWQLTPRDRILMVAPAFHIFGQAMLVASCAAQATVILLPRFEPEAFLRTIEQQGVTFFAGVPTLAHFLLNVPQVSHFDLGSLRSVMFSGAALHPTIAERFKQRFGVDVITGYGMTEAVPITFVTAEMADAPPTSVGTPVLGTRMRIVDERGEDTIPGEPGEVVIRGPQVFAGYYNKPDTAGEVWIDDWFRTGDIGRVDANGHLFLIDRRKHMIKTAGYTVFPAEVERTLFEHPDIVEAVVVGIPHKALGEVVQAYLVVKPETTTTPNEFIAYCKGQLAAYKCPKRVEIRDSLPKSPTGKVLRSALKDAGISS